MNEETRSDLFILAVEDDPIFAENLSMVLEEMGYSNFTIVDNAASALKLFTDRQPDILLADIHINGPINGIELASMIMAIRPIPVVFLTSYADSETFRRAKDTKPAAYLIKPYHATNLQAAIELALENQAGVRRQEQSRNSLDQPPSNDSFFPLSDALFVKFNGRLFKIKVDEILFIEVEEKYCYIHTQSRKYAVNMRLKNLLDQLPADSFVQIHRSYAVKLDAIEEVNTEQHSIMIKGTSIPIGKTYREMFLGKLKMI